MRTLITCTLIAAFLAAVTMAAPQQDAGNAGTIQGVILRTASGEPVEGATVTATFSADSEFSATTDRNGAFRLGELPPGSFSLSISRPGFLPFSERISLSPKQQFTGMRVQLTATGSISGRVLDNNRQPIVGAVVMAIRPTFVNGRRVLVPDLAHTGSLHSDE